MSEENEQSRQPEPVEPAPPTQRPRDTDALVIWGFVLAGLGLFGCCCLPIFEIPAIILGAIAYSRGDQRGLWVIIAAVVVLLAGGALSITLKPHRWVPYFEDRWPGQWRRA